MPLLPLIAGLGAILVLGVAVLLIRSSGPITDKSLCDYAARRLAKDSGYTGDDLKLAIEMAGYYHSEARVVLARAGERGGRHGIEEKHYDALRSFIDKEMREVKAGDQDVSSDLLAGYWFTYSFPHDTADYSRWSPSGEYISMTLNGRALEGTARGTAHPGKWSLEGKRIICENGGSTPVVHLSPRHLVIRNADGSLTHFRRLSVPSSQQALDELLRIQE